MAFEAIAITSNVGKQRLAQLLSTGKAFQITSFVVGDGGHDPGDPTTALTPDPSDVTCSGALFGPEVIDSSSVAAPFCPQFECILEVGEATGNVSSICLVATIVFNGTDPVDEIGNTFLFAIAHFPLKVKTALDQFDFTITVQL